MILYTEDIERLEKIRTYINSNLSHELNASAIAKKFEINKYKLNRHFSQQFNTTLFRYILEQRMNCALELLSKNALPVSEVAKLVGYEDKSVFNHAFTNYFGSCPSAVLSNKHMPLVKS